MIAGARSSIGLLRVSAGLVAMAQPYRSGPLAQSVTVGFGASFTVSVKTSGRA